MREVEPSTYDRCYLDDCHFTVKEKETIFHVSHSLVIECNDSDSPTGIGTR
jgi:hypothetical protein